MVDAMKAALRLLPVVVKSVPGGTCVGCSRSSFVRRHAPVDRPSALFSLTSSQQGVAAERQQNSVTGFARFAKAVLAYVGVGFSAVAANQLAGNPTVVLAKGIGKNRKDSCFMATEEARASWQHAAKSHYLCQVDLKGQKSCSGMLVLQQDINESKEAKIETEEEFLSVPLDDWQTADKTGLPWQFGPSAKVVCGSDCVDLEQPSVSESVKLETDPVMQMKKTGYSGLMDMELEWQWVIDQQELKPNQQELKSKCCEAPISQSRNTCKEIVNEDVDEAYDVHEECTKCQQENEVLGMVQGSNRNSNVGQLLQAGLNGKQTSISGAVKPQAKSGKLSMELGACGLNGKLTPIAGALKPDWKPGNLSMELGNVKHHRKDSSSWRTADRNELAALVSQKTLECLENCDLPSSQSSVTCNGPLASCDLTPNQSDFTRSVDKMLLASLLCGNEPTSLENRSLPSSPLVLGTSDPTPLQKHFPRSSELLTTLPFEAPVDIMKIQQDRNLSMDGRSTSWSGSGGNFTGGGQWSDTLGEALCHSQTRAREAEKAAAQASQEKERLLQLFFRETSLSLTYKQWVRLLEIENAWLRMHFGDFPALWMEHSYLNPALAFGRLSNNRWKHLGKRFHQKQIRHIATLLPKKDHCCKWACGRSNVVVGCTIGLAFALGFSLAGAGLMIGWSMGWIFLAY